MIAKSAAPTEFPADVPGRSVAQAVSRSEIGQIPDQERADRLGHRFGDLTEAGTAPIQRVTGLSAGTYVEVTNGRVPWYGQVVEDLGGSYKIRLGGGSKSDVHVIDEKHVDLHPMFRGKSSKSVQQEDPFADFGEWQEAPEPIEPVRVPIGKCGVSAGELFTKGLGDCTCIVAYVFGEAAMYHVLSPAQCLPGDEEGLLELKKLYETKRDEMLKLLSDTTNVQFQVILGGEWESVWTKTKIFKTGQSWVRSFLMMLRELFPNIAFMGFAVNAKWEPFSQKLQKM